MGKNIIHKISYKNKNFNNNKTYLQTFIRTFLKKGNYKKLNIIMSKIFILFFNFFFKNDLFKNFHLSNQIHIIQYNFNTNKNLFLLDFIVKDIIQLLNPSFNYKVNLNNKKKEKKLK